MERHPVDILYDDLILKTLTLRREIPGCSIAPPRKPNKFDYECNKYGISYLLLKDYGEDCIEYYKPAIYEFADGTQGFIFVAVMHGDGKQMIFGRTYKYNAEIYDTVNYEFAKTNEDVVKRMIKKMHNK